MAAANASLTWAYIRKFEKLLRQRKAFKKFFDEAKDAFYSMYSVGEYTFLPYKVAGWTFRQPSRPPSSRHHQRRRCHS